MSNDRVFSFPIVALTSLTAVPFVQLATPSTTGIEIISLRLGQDTSETSQQEAITFSLRSTASTLPTATTPRALFTGGSISLLTGSTTTNTQGIASATGTLTWVLWRENFNVLNGYIYLPMIEERIRIAPSSFFTIEFATAPAANTWSGTLVFKEVQ